METAATLGLRLEDSTLHLKTNIVVSEPRHKTISKQFELFRLSVNMHFYNSTFIHFRYDFLSSRPWDLVTFFLESAADYIINSQTLPIWERALTYPR